MTEESAAHSAASELSKSYIQECTRLLSALESAQGALRLTRKDCFELWSKVGTLRSDKWSSLSSVEKQNLKLTTEKLLDRLKTLLATGRQDLLDCLESGMSKALSEAEHSRKEVERFLKRGQISRTLTSAELNAGLFYWRDELGFALLLSEELGLELSPKTRDRVEQLDEEMRKILPEVLRIYREAEDDPTPYPERFPDEFWWRQLS